MYASGSWPATEAPPSAKITLRIARMMSPRVFLHTWYRKHDIDPKEDKKTLEDVQKEESAKSFREAKEAEDQDESGGPPTPSRRRSSFGVRGSMAAAPSVGAAPGQGRAAMVRMKSMKSMKSQNVVGSSAMARAMSRPLVTPPVAMIPRPRPDSWATEAAVGIPQSQ